MRSTIVAIVSCGLVLAAEASAQQQLPPVVNEPKVARQPSTAVTPSGADSEKKSPEQDKEAESWKPDTPGAIEVVVEQPTPFPQFQFRAEYINWWYKEMPLPPILTRGLTSDINPGAIGQPGTVVMLGNENLFEKPQSGVRSGITYWFDPEQCLGAEVSGFFLVSRSVVVIRPSSTGPTFPVQGEPFNNAVTGSPDVSLFLFQASGAPPLVNGTDHIIVTTRLWGAEANGLANLWCWRGLRFDALAGFRTMQFYESINMGQFTQVESTAPIVGGQVAAGYDYFGVTNNFYGGQVGLRSVIQNGRLFLEVQAKAAVGDVQEVLNIAGQTTIIQPGQPTRTLPGDLYALSSNIGGHSKTSFAVLPEGNVNIGWQVLEHLRLRLGYSFLYLSRVARAGSQIDTTLNPNLIPISVTYGAPGGTLRPGVRITESDFTVQGFNFGLELTY